MFRIYLLITLATISTINHARPPTDVFTVIVGTQEVNDRVEALGNLIANEATAITATVTETISAIHFDDGERVSKGQVLVEMTSQEQKALLAEAQASVEEASSQLDRLKSLKTKGLSTASLLDQQQRQYNVAKARLSAIQSQLDDRLITAPFNGVVGLRNISVGALVRPGDIITTLIDDSKMKLDFSMPAIYLQDIGVGMPIEATSRAFPHEVFSGTVASIDNRIDRVTRSVTVRAILDNAERKLKQGLLMQVVMLTNPRSALTVPEESLISVQDNHFVYVVEKKDEQSVAVKKQVTTGTLFVGHIEVLSGINVGDEVVIHGALKIADQAPVNVAAREDQDTATLTQLLKVRDSSLGGNR